MIGGGWFKEDGADHRQENAETSIAKDAFRRQYGDRQS